MRDQAPGQASGHAFAYDYPTFANVPDLEAEALYKHVKTKHVRIERRDPIARQMPILADRTCNDGILKPSHQVVHCVEKLQAKAGILQPLKSVTVAHNIGSM